MTNNCVSKRFRKQLDEIQDNDENKASIGNKIYVLLTNVFNRKDRVLFSSVALPIVQDIEWVRPSM